MTRVAKYVTGQEIRLVYAWQEAYAFGVLLEGGIPLVLLASLIISLTIKLL